MKGLLSRAIPDAAKPLFRKVYEYTLILMLRLFSSSEHMANLYYALISNQFGREHRSVLRGRVAYQKSLKELKKSSALLRRNVHRIEKGLIMRPRRPVFGESFIGETVECFARAASSDSFSIGELKWARDVIDRYFEAVGDSAVISAARNRYFDGPARSSVQLGPEGRSFSPYPRNDCPTIDISYEQIFGLFLRRRSVRWYVQRSVPRDALEMLVDAAAYAPSACNRQPFRFVIADSPPGAVEIAKCAGGTGGFADNLQTVIVVVGDLSAYPEERDRHLIYIDGALASMQLMLSAETMGLSTCPINWPDVRPAERRIEELLDLLGHERVIMLIAVGYGDPEGEVPYSQKKSSSDLVTYY